MPALAALALSAGVATTGRARDENRGVTWLGVYTQTLSRELRDGLDYDGDEGVLVNRVVDGSPADRAGIRQGDVIVSVNSRRVDSPDELASIVRGAEPGQTVSVRIVRDGTTRSVSARLEERGDRREDDDVPTPTPRGFEPPEPPDAPDAPEAPESPGMRHFEFRVPGPGDGENFAPFAMGMGRGRLGVRVEALSRDLADYFDVPDGKGVLVIEVMKDTPAERAGIRAGDVITRVGDRSVYEVDDLVSALREREGRVRLTVMRKGSRRTIEAELERSPRAMRPGRDRMLLGRDLTRRSTDRTRDRIRLRDDSGDDREAMRREIEQLRREVKELQKQLEDEREDDR